MGDDVDLGGLHFVTPDNAGAGQKLQRLAADEHAFTEVEIHVYAELPQRSSIQRANSGPLVLSSDSSLPCAAIFPAASQCERDACTKNTSWARYERRTSCMEA